MFFNPVMFFNPGLPCCRFNFRVNDPNLAAVHSQLQEMFRRQKFHFRLNYSFGFLLRHQETGQLRFFHPSQNNTRVLPVPVLIATQADFEDFLDSLPNQDILEWARQQRPDTKWFVEGVTNVTFYLNQLRDFPLSG